MKDFYGILGVRHNATLAEIKRAYREKVKQLHPDLTGDSTRRDEFNEVVQAYRVLSDNRQRSIFDESFFVKSAAPIKTQTPSIIMNGLRLVMMRRAVLNLFSIPSCIRKKMKLLQSSNACRPITQISP